MKRPNAAEAKRARSELAMNVDNSAESVSLSDSAPSTGMSPDSMSQTNAVFATFLDGFETSEIGSSTAACA